MSRNPYIEISERPSSNDGFFTPRSSYGSCRNDGGDVVVEVPNTDNENNKDNETRPIPDLPIEMIEKIMTYYWRNEMRSLDQDNKGMEYIIRITNPIRSCFVFGGSHFTELGMEWFRSTEFKDALFQLQTLNNQFVKQKKMEEILSSKNALTAMRELKKLAQSLLPPLDDSRAKRRAAPYCIFRAVNSPRFAAAEGGLGLLMVLVTIALTAFVCDGGFGLDGIGFALTVSALVIADAGCALGLYSLRRTDLSRDLEHDYEKYVGSDVRIIKTSERKVKKKEAKSIARREVRFKPSFLADAKKVATADYFEMAKPRDHRDDLSP